MNAEGDENPNFCAPIIAIGREEVLLDNENSKPTSEGKKSHGFHLIRSKWDPYPWIDSVESGSSADSSGLRSGDCLLEIDGRDVLGLEMKDIAHLMGKSNRVNLSIWRQPSKCSTAQPSDEDLINLNENDSSDMPVPDSKDRGSSLLDGPLPEVSRRLVRAVSGVVKALECPVCLESAAPPVSQCVHGHLLCFGCRLKSSRCPVCRVRLGQGRCLLADKTHRVLSEALVKPNKRASLSSSLSAKFERDDLNAPSRSLLENIFGTQSASFPQNPSKNHHHQETEHQKQRKRNNERSPMRQFLHRLVHSSSSSSSIPNLLNRSSRRRAKNNEDDRTASTESLPTTSSHSREKNRSDLNKLLNSKSGSNTSLATSKAHRKDEDNDDEDETTAGCSMDGNLLYGRRWLLRLYDRRKSASTGELHRGASRRDRDDEDEAMERVGSGADDDGRRRRRRELEDRPPSGLLSVPQTPVWGGSTESMMISKICCPLKHTAGCEEMVHHDTLMEHLQEAHNGPIIHFYKSDIVLPFPFPFQEEAVYVICLNDDTFVLQSHGSKIWMCSAKANDEIRWKWSAEEVNADHPKKPTMKSVAGLLPPFVLSAQNVVIIPKCYSGLLHIMIVDEDSLEGCIV